MQEPAPSLPDPFLRLNAGDISCPAPVFTAPGDTVARAAALMAAAGTTAALVRAEGGAILGILTERDVLVRVAAAGLPPNDTPVGAVMTAGLVTVGRAEPLIEAFSRMVRHRVRRLVLLDDTGTPTGLLGEGDMLAARGESPLSLAKDIDAAADEAELTRNFHQLTRLAARCVAEGLGSEAVGRLISEMHDRIMSRAWGLALAQVAAAHGPAPAPHAVLTLGSQARREQYFATDQDLALCHEGGPEAGRWFLLLGQRLTAILTVVGFPPCPRRIMLDNPLWVRRADAWLDLADTLAERPDDEAVVTASLLADLRPLPAPPESGHSAYAAADPALGRRMRQSISLRLSESALLLKRMALEAVRFSPPLGLFRGFSLTRGAGGHGQLDVKRGGVFPLTQGAKVLALEHHLPETGSLGRLRALGRMGALAAPQAKGLCEALALLQTLRMRAQAVALAQNMPLDNELRPDDLGALEREGLRGAFRLTAEFQDLLTGKYALRLLG